VNGKPVMERSVEADVRTVMRVARQTAHRQSLTVEV
jgi:hypothetical protein